MQGLPLPTREPLPAIRCLDEIILICFCDRGEFQDLPITMFQNVPNEIIFMEALHNQNDAACTFIVKAGEN